MGSEIDTKSIEPVRNAVSLFGDKGDQKKYQAAKSKVNKRFYLECLKINRQVNSRFCFICWSE